MQQNRLFDAEWMAAPSFHAAWTVITMQALSQQYGRFRFLFWISTLLVCASCVLTGSHAIADVLIGMVLAILSGDM
ncbi:MAG: phosphatase PAP2 family protein [Polaromonas sp.]|nr:phosphatase PAP2 family protein [Polaromonas sp.]